MLHGPMKLFAKHPAFAGEYTASPPPVRMRATVGGTADDTSTTCAGGRGGTAGQKVIFSWDNSYSLCSIILPTMHVSNFCKNTSQ